MQELVQQGLIERKTGEQGVSYLLAEETLFSQTRMKAIESSEDPCILKCVRVLYNGKIKLVYLTSAYRRLDQCLPGMKSGYYRTLAGALMKEVLFIRGNSILSCGCIDLSADRVFVDWSEKDVRLVCLPVRERVPMPEAEFESMFREKLLQWGRQLPPEEQGGLEELNAQLSDPAKSLQEMAAHFGPRRHRDQAADPVRRETGGTQLVLTSVGTVPPVTLVVEHTPFLIGREWGAVDGAIPSEYLRVGRKHCRIEAGPEGYRVVDVNSKNGTWVDDRKLQPLVPAELPGGSVLRLANVSFAVRITGGGA